MSNANLLRTWGSESYSSQTEAAEAIGIGQAYFNHLVQGNRRPSLKVAARIEEETEGWAQGPIRAVDWIVEAETPPPAHDGTGETEAA